VYVPGYTTKDGTVVKGYWRSNRPAPRGPGSKTQAQAQAQAAMRKGR
jgi:hypothetical protein